MCQLKDAVLLLLLVQQVAHRVEGMCPVTGWIFTFSLIPNIKSNYNGKSVNLSSFCRGSCLPGPLVWGATAMVWTILQLCLLIRLVLFSSDLVLTHDASEQMRVKGLAQGSNSGSLVVLGLNTHLKILKHWATTSQLYDSLIIPTLFSRLQSVFQH